MSLFCFLVSCDGTFVTKKIIDSENYKFEHAGQEQNLLIELKQIKTFTRRNGVFSLNPGPVERNTTFDYAIYASVNNGEGLHEIYEYPCSKDAKLDDFIAKIQIKRSKDRTHFALAFENEIIGIWHSMLKVSFLADYPLNPNGTVNYKLNELNFSSLKKPREDLLSYLSKKKKLLISDKQIHDILTKLKPNDELNYEISFSIADAEILSDEKYQTAVIKYCKQDKNWKINALKSIKNKKENLSTAQYVSRLHAIGGMEELVREDEYQYKLFKSNNDFLYFSDRISNTNFLLSEKIRKSLIIDVKHIITHPCALNSSEINNFYENLEFAEKLGIQKPFDLFFQAYEKENCFSKSLFKLTDEFMFPSVVIGESDKRKWVELVVKNFNSISSDDKRWAYRRLEEHITCDQKRMILLKYKKDIDVFNDMEIPVCR